MLAHCQPHLVSSSCQHEFRLESLTSDYSPVTTSDYKFQSTLQTLTKERNESRSCMQWGMKPFEFLLRLQPLTHTGISMYITYWPLINDHYSIYIIHILTIHREFFSSYFKASISCKAEMKVVKERIQRGGECPDDALASMMHKMHLSEFLVMTLFMWWWSLWIW